MKQKILSEKAFNHKITGVCRNGSWSYSDLRQHKGMAWVLHKGAVMLLKTGLYENDVFSVNEHFVRGNHVAVRITHLTHVELRGSISSCSLFVCSQRFHGQQRTPPQQVHAGNIPHTQRRHGLRPAVDHSAVSTAAL